MSVEKRGKTMEEMLNRLMPLNLQFFADGGEGDSDTQDTGNNDTDTNADDAEPEGESASKKAQPIDLIALLGNDKALQSQFDRLMGKALNTAHIKWEKEKDMSADQIAEEKAQEKRQELAEREQALITKELRADAIGILGEKSLPAELVDCVSLSDAASMKSSIVKVEKVFRAAVEKAVHTQLKGSAPKAGGGATEVNEFEKRLKKYERK